MLCLLNVLFIGFATGGPYPDMPSASTTVEVDMAQMRWQVNVSFPPQVPRQQSYDKYIYPKLKALGSDVTLKPSSTTNIDAHWDWATGTSTTWPKADGTGDRLIGKATTHRTPAGLWNNYIQAWEPAGAYFTGAQFYEALKLHDLTGLTREDWPKRRADIFAAVQQTYGKVPAAAAKMKIAWSVTGSGSSYTITGTITNPSGYVARRQPRISGTLRVPSGVAGKKYPIIIYIGGADESLWSNVSPAGIGTFSYSNYDLQPDSGGSATSSYIIGLVNEGKWRKPEDWGGLVAWAWGISRLLDFFEENPKGLPVDAKHVGVTGHSRYGKAALVAMAYEERLWISFPSSSGKMGAAPARRHLGEELGNVAGDSSEYHWLAGSSLRFVGVHPSSTDGYMPRKALDMPADAESLVALCAPRPLFIGSGRPEQGEAWVDPYGVFLGAYKGSPVYEFLGVKGLVMTDSMTYKGQKIPMPTIGKAYIEGTIGYRNHGGGHVETPNYPAFVQFAKRFLPTASLTVDQENDRPQVEAVN